MNESDADAIRNLNTRFTEIIESDNITDLLELFAEDGVDSPPGQPPNVGKAALRKRLEWMNAETSVRIKSDVAQIEVSGDLGYVRCTYQAWFTSRTSGETTENPGNWIQIFRRGPDGRWKIIQNIFNSSV
jgi:uncharacterized protein (TIGR02246 family)